VVAVLLFSVLAVVQSCAGSPVVTGGSKPGLEEATGYTDERWNRLLRKHESNIVQCMRSRGFKFWSTASWAYLTLNPHGLFGLRTPSAEHAYLASYGYGVVRRVAVLKAEHRSLGRPTNEAYAASLPAERRQAYARALFGSDGAPGCAQPESDVVLRLGLPDGGELGDAYGQALDRARKSDNYVEWQQRVVDCLRKAGVEVPAGDLDYVERPFLERLLTLAGSAYTVDGEAIAYDLSLKDAARISARSLRDLHADEMETAAIEFKCREDAGTQAQDAVDAETLELVDEYAEEVSLLRASLQQAE
jgi:hypothetical protein